MLQGRFHLYEGNDPGLVVQPVLLFKALGARIVVLTNAAGGVDPAFGPGTLMVIADHLNLTGRTPLLGPNADEYGAAVRGPDRRLEPAAASALRAAGRGGGRRARARASTPGCSGRTTRPRPRSGCSRRWARRGRDVHGARGDRRPLGRARVCGVSLVTNAGAGYTGEPLTHEEVLEAGAEAGPRLARVIRRFVEELGGDPRPAG